MQKKKFVVYQVFTRLFGNKVAKNKTWGTVAENGVGKFNDFTDKALSEIKKLGVSHIWYTGVPHHALVADYEAYGIDSDHPSVVKGRAGSPYAVKDYYNVNPDLAVDPANRLAEFQALVERSHANGLKVIIDIVPNHVARRYKGNTNPAGVADFGDGDDTSVAYHRDNNFYYIPEEAFELPDFEHGYLPLGGEAHPMMVEPYVEYPAKWTGNGSRLAKPNFDDWYETVKVNYGIRPDGSKDFPELPEGYASRCYQAHYAYWQTQSVPDSWQKFRDVALYWLAMGVDGFRYDMAEMVPVEFWSYMNSAIKMVNPEAFLMAEVYQPHLYREYIHLGKMDYLYDKVDLYDTLKAIMQGTQSTDAIVEVQAQMQDIEHHMLHFLDNHDEQRVASPEFAGCAEKGKPGLVVSALLSTSPTMVYFGQEVGEPGADNAGFGQHSRTTIFDYFGVPYHQRWMNNGAFDGGLLTDGERDLRAYYQRVLNVSLNSHAAAGGYTELHTANRVHAQGYEGNVFSFARESKTQIMLVVANFDALSKDNMQLVIPEEVIANWTLADGDYCCANALIDNDIAVLNVEAGIGYLSLALAPLGSAVLMLER